MTHDEKCESTVTGLFQCRCELRELRTKVAALEERAHLVDASISCAAMGHYKRGEPMHDDHKTVGLNDVLDLRDKWLAVDARIAALCKELAEVYSKEPIDEELLGKMVTGGESEMTCKHTAAERIDALEAGVK